MNAADWRHVAYPKITERLDSLGLDERQMRATNHARYVAREKIHGANMALHTDGVAMRAARRKDWLADDEHEGFFRCGALLRSLTAPVLSVHRALGIGARRVVLFGELFGGRYPHERVAADPRYAAVQTGVWYSPTLEFAAFDLAIIGDDGGLAFVGAAELDALCGAAGLRTAPIVARGRLTDVLAAPLPFESRIPAMLGLPSLRDNVAEGLVVTPAERARGAAVDAPRVVLKRKLDRFAEDARYAGAQRATSAPPYATLHALVTPARVAAAWSKFADVRRIESEAFVLELRDRVVADVIESWLEEKPHLAHAVHDRSEAFVTLRATSERAVREWLRAHAQQ